jgi:hypothetical protein
VRLLDAVLDTAEDPRNRVLHPDCYTNGAPWEDLRETQWSG